jgi:ubiquinone biosynthesis protein COQ9
VILESEQNKIKIFKNLLKIIPEYGLNEDSLLIAIEKTGFDRKNHIIFFEDSISSLLEFVDFYLNQQMIKIYQSQTQFLENASISKSITSLLKIRFDLIIENKIFYQEIIGKKINYLRYFIKNSYNLSDMIWFEIGDKSTDYNFYTKRVLSSKIYLKTLIFADKNDYNKDLIDQYIENQIKNTLKIQKIKNSINNFCKKTSKITSEVNFDYIKNFSIKKLPFIRLFNNIK